MKPSSIVRTLLMASVLGLPSLASAELACERAAPAAALLESFAINTHLQQGWQYEDFERTVATLKDLGITQIREAFVGLGQAGHEHAARQGMRLVFFIQGGDLDQIIPRLEAWQTRYPGSILAIEGPNEVNNFPIQHRGLAGIPAAQAFQSDLYDRVHASPVLNRIPVLALTSWPVFANKSDIGNIHAYSRRGGFMTDEIQGAIKDERNLNPPEKPIWMTEGGYHTHLGEDYDEGVSEAVQAKMATTMFLSAFAQGVDKSFYYQLLNQYTDPNDQQSYFGLVDQQWKPKPAFEALKSMVAIVREAAEGGGASGEPGGLLYGLDDLPASAQRAVFRSPNGDWLIAVWNEADIWDRANNVEIDVPSTDVTLQLGSLRSDVALYDPLRGPSPVRTVENADRVSFHLSTSPMLLRVRPVTGSSAAAGCMPGE